MHTLSYRNTLKICICTFSLVETRAHTHTFSLSKKHFHLHARTQVKRITEANKCYPLVGKIPDTWKHNNSQAKAEADKGFKTYYKPARPAVQNTWTTR